ncbi:MAG: 30S ribosomal protein S20 [Candidatus Ureaplasma intestinipullorum]|uniref:Small ribosomal subunit protein bS20 n=1 Tax=Candidatus Ureaplasma intestinipullorum TaxID=2838770 RepID=A0A9E2KV46_9BACT|nr:30S ribosomal protein S20 [Candidatus Ureaplasma intestinipullorum]
MANIKSNEKSLRQDTKVHKNNHSQLAKMRTQVKKTNNNLSDETVSETYKVVDTVARKGIIHKNKANRIKSRIAMKNNATKK